MLRHSAIVDDLLRDSEVVQWRETAAHFSAGLFLIECICSDAVIHRARIEGRARGIPGWHEVGWDYVERMRAECPAHPGSAHRQCRRAGAGQHPSCTESHRGMIRPGDR